MEDYVGIVETDVFIVMHLDIYTIYATLFVPLPLMIINSSTALN